MTKAVYALAASILIASIITAVAFRYTHDGNTITDRWTGRSEYDGIHNTFVRP